jgi:hypothetical protein
MQAALQSCMSALRQVRVRWEGGVVWRGEAEVRVGVRVGGAGRGCGQGEVEMGMWCRRGEVEMRVGVWCGRGEVEVRVGGVRVWVRVGGASYVQMKSFPFQGEPGSWLHAWQQARGTCSPPQHQRCHAVQPAASERAITSCGVAVLCVHTGWTGANGCEAGSYE